MIVLIGFKHVGKSSAGKLLAEKKGLDFYDLDHLIEDKAGMTPRELMKTEGKEAFRKLERECLESVLDKRGVLAVGGGTPITCEDLLADHFCIHLRAEQDQVYEWILESGPTPLFETREDFEKLWEQRMPVYKRLENASMYIDHLEEWLDVTLNAVIGYPLEHSKSPELHNAIYKSEGIPAHLHKMSHPQLSVLMQVLEDLQVQLVAVTMPFKEQVIDYCEVMEERAEQLSSVNTLIRRGDKWYGFNTDYDGIAAALSGVNCKTAVLLGAGGAARPVALYLKEQGAELYIINRSHEKAVKLAEEFGGQAIHPEEIPKDTTLIVNATPVGMHPHEDATPLDPSFIPQGASGFDLVYNPEQTRFLKSIPQKKISGKTMFIAQGLRQVELWTGRPISPKDNLNLI